MKTLTLYDLTLGAASRLLKATVEQTKDRKAPHLLRLSVPYLTEMLIGQAAENFTPSFEISGQEK